jgi:hypothetical protein
VDIQVAASLPSPVGILILALLIAGVCSLALAVVNERRMQRHRLPGVSYRDVTLRRDGAWKRSDLFFPEGLGYQRRASKWGVIGALLLLLAVGIAWLAL